MRARVEVRFINIWKIAGGSGKRVQEIRLKARRLALYCCMGHHNICLMCGGVLRSFMGDQEAGRPRHDINEI